MHRLLPSRRALLLAPALLLLVAACGSGSAQWTFQPSPVPTASPTGTASPTETSGATASPNATGTAAVTGCSPDARIVKIDETATLHMDPASVDVTKAEKICFEVTNVGGVTHDFHVGLQSDTDAGNASALVGTDPFSAGTKTVEFTFDGNGPYGYVCLIHRTAGMKGTINLQ